MNGLINSKKIINILNRCCEYCCCYYILVDPEIIAAFSKSCQASTCPEDILRTPNLCTPAGLGFNNSDYLKREYDRCSIKRFNQFNRIIQSESEGMRDFH